MDKTYQATWTAMENATGADFKAVMDYEEQYNAELVEPLLAQLKLLDEAWTPYPVNRYQHSLQSVTPEAD